MTFLTTPLMRSFVGFDSLFDEFERMSEYTDNKYPAYNIIKSGDEEYKIELAVAGFNENDISIEVKKGLMTIEASNPNTLVNTFIEELQKDLLQNNSDFLTILKLQEQI